MPTDKGGRPKKPTARRTREGGTKRQGAISHRPMPDKTETGLVAIAGRDVPVSPPDDLPPHAKDLWLEIVRVLAEAGVADKVDLPALRLFCIQYARAYSAKDVLDAPIDEDGDAALEQRLNETSAILGASKSSVANMLRAGVDVPPAKLNAIANLETVLASLEAYRDARRRVGNLVALGSTGQLVAHPLLDVERQAANLCLRFGGRFGLTPADRASLGLALIEGHTRSNELATILGASPRSRK